jgi:23S rRNA (pseudouridine1915-N3)-methyltransferase
MRLLCVGKVKEDYLMRGIEEYLRKINYFAKFEIIRVKDSSVKQEGEALLSRINDEFVIALGEEGKHYSSVEFSQMLGKVNKEIVFIIGSGEGLSEEVKKRANLVLSLSKMTFLHEMAQLVLLEQVYRHLMIKNSRAYHR